MPTIKFQGRDHDFPEGMTDDQIRDALGSVADTNKQNFTASPGTQQAKSLAVDFNFIREQEGGALTNGYIPFDAPGGVESGVTIATGLDLGQHDAASLRRMGVRDELVDRMRPYLGVKGTEAMTLLGTSPLRITKEEAELVDTGVKSFVTIDLAKRFDKDSNNSFSQLPKEWQTVIASVAFQYGQNLSKRTPNFWRQVTTGDLKGALANLRNFGDDYGTRRNREADFIQNT